MGRNHKICNLSDICRHFGASDRTVESLSHRIYKDTDCGAWAKVEQQLVGGRRQLWRATINNSIIGPRLLHAGLVHGQQLPMAKLPERVREWLQLKPNGTINMTWTEIKKLQPELDISQWRDATGEGQIVRVTHNRGQVVVTFVLLRPITRPAFVCGSIIEGSDAEVGPIHVVLPCKPSDLDSIVEDVEAEASRLWDETHDNEEA